VTREQHRIVDHWRSAIGRAIDLGDADAAYRLTRGLVVRCRELWIVPRQWQPADERRDCPACGRRMSEREAREQAICNDCAQ